MTPLTCMRRLVPLLAAFLMISCGDPSVSYCKKVADHQCGIFRKKATHWRNGSSS